MQEMDTLTLSWISYIVYFHIVVVDGNKTPDRSEAKFNIQI